MSPPARTAVSLDHAIAGSADGAASYASDGAVVLRGFVDPDLAGFLCSYAQLRAANGEMHTAGNQVPGSSEMYGDPAVDTLLGRLTGPLSEALALPLAPTYSFLRVYRYGQVLTPHRDRPSCEHSFTLHLGASEPMAWPVELTDRHGNDKAVALEQGDMVGYLGCELTHWRTACPVDWYIQAFLHYVDPTGPNAGYRLDGRDQLGRPSVGR